MLAAEHGADEVAGQAIDALEGSTACALPMHETTPRADPQRVVVIDQQRPDHVIGQAIGGGVSLDVSVLNVIKTIECAAPEITSPGCRE